LQEEYQAWDVLIRLLSNLIFNVPSIVILTENFTLSLPLPSNPITDSRPRVYVIGRGGRQWRIYIEAKEAVLRGPRTQGAPNIYKKKGCGITIMRNAFNKITAC